MDKFKPRFYQQAAVENLIHNLRVWPHANPLIVLPTGAGKSYVMADGVRRMHQHSAMRTLVLTHRADLVRQDLKHLRDVDPQLSVAVCCADIHQGEACKLDATGDPDSAQVVVGTVQTIASRLRTNPACLGKFSRIWIDEAHRVPHQIEQETSNGKPQYTRVLNTLGGPDVPIIGMTATPWRMEGGHICYYSTEQALRLAYERDPQSVRYDPAGAYTFTYVTYDGSKHISRMIEDGYLANITSRLSDICDLHGQPEPRMRLSTDFSKVRIDKKTNDFDVQEQEQLVLSSLEEALQILLSMPPEVTQRKRWIAFLPGQESAIRFAEMLNKAGFPTGVCTHQYPPNRDAQRRVINDFKAGKLQCLCSVEKFTEGFDVPDIDLIIMLRRTQSSGLYIQMLGRGMRQDAEHPKKECFVLDMVGVTDEMGSIADVYLRSCCSDKLMPDPTALSSRIKQITCVHCQHKFSRDRLPPKPELYGFQCPSCGHLLYTHLRPKEASQDVIQAKAPDSDTGDGAQVQDVGLYGQTIDLISKYPFHHEISVQNGFPPVSTKASHDFKYPDFKLLQCKKHVSKRGNLCLNMQIDLPANASPVAGQRRVTCYLTMRACKQLWRKIVPPRSKRRSMPDKDMLPILASFISNYANSVQLTWDQDGEYRSYPRLTQLWLAAQHA